MNRKDYGTMRETIKKYKVIKFDYNEFFLEGNTSVQKINSLPNGWEK